MAQSMQLTGHVTTTTNTNFVGSINKGADGAPVPTACHHFGTDRPLDEWGSGLASLPPTDQDQDQEETKSSPSNADHSSIGQDWQEREREITARSRKQKHDENVDIGQDCLSGSSGSEWRDDSAHTAKAQTRGAEQVLLWLRRRQAVPVSERYTAVSVLGVSATVTLLPVVGLGGQVVTPVIVPASAPATTSTSPSPPETVTSSSSPSTTTFAATPTTSSITAASIASSTAQSITLGIAVNNSTVEGMVNPAQGPYLGGSPIGSVDLPVTIVFLLMFLLAAHTHISIYRANSARGHKFLLSDLVCEFCMVRICTCIFRIVWIFLPLPGIILTALIFQFGGAAVLFVILVFCAQRIVRAMHPRFGWTQAFGIWTMVLAWSVPTVILLNIASLIVSFVSVANQERVGLALKLLYFGMSWNVWLSVYPLLVLFLCSAFPGPQPERFGTGSFRAKVAILVYVSVTLAVGACVRLASIANPVQPGTEQSSALFNRAVFYTTNLTLEILVVLVFALFRIDLRFHVPDGSQAPGDYSSMYPDKHADHMVPAPKNLRDGNDQWTGARYAYAPITSNSSTSGDTLGTLPADFDVKNGDILTPPLQPVAAFPENRSPPDHTLLHARNRNILRRVPGPGLDPELAIDSSELRFSCRRSPQILASRSTTSLPSVSSQQTQRPVSSCSHDRTTDYHEQLSPSVESTAS